MTTTQPDPPKPAPSQPPSTLQPDLPFSAGSWAKLRCRPADFARLAEVSRQTVSVWMRKGVVQVGADGMLDPIESARRVLKQTNPARLRARLFKDLAKPVSEHAARTRELEAELATARAEIDALRAHQHRLLHPDDVARQVFVLEQRIVGAFDDLVAARAENMLSDYVSVMLDEIFYPDSAQIDEDLD